MRGFTLIELIVAVTLSGVVLLGIMGISAQMVRFQMQGARSGDVTGWTLLGLQQMTRELESANVLDCPHASGCGLTSTRLSACTNYTKQTNAALRAQAGTDTVAFLYCVPTAGQYAYHLLRYEQISSSLAPVCPMSPMPTCGSNPGSGQTMQVIVKGFYPIDGTSPYPFFTRADDVAGVRLRFQVGLATATPEIGVTDAGPIPTFMRFDTKVGMNKNFSNTAD